MIFSAADGKSYGYEVIEIKVEGPKYTIIRGNRTSVYEDGKTTENTSRDGTKIKVRSYNYPFFQYTSFIMICHQSNWNNFKIDLQKLPFNSVFWE